MLWAPCVWSALKALDLSVIHLFRAGWQCAQAYGWLARLGSETLGDSNLPFVRIMH